MTHFWFGVLGVGISVVGALLLKYNAQFVRAMPPPRGPAARMKMFQPGRNGRVPVLTFISAGWVVGGLVFLWVAATNQPL